MKKIRFRYAPSPTGRLHIGGARTALFNYLAAKNKGGEFLLRIEDTDFKREIENGEASQIDNLIWMGVVPDYYPGKEDDCGPYRQSERLDIYIKYANELLEKGLAYECYCSEEELEEDREAQIAKGIPSPRYSRKCLHNPMKKEGVKPSIRLRMPEDEDFTWDDGVRGTITINSKEISDWVIVKSNDVATYSFANVIDDHLMRITDVMRGEEHISNTPKQIHLYKLFGFEIPRFHHLTIITNDQGKKLSKRDQSLFQFIEEYRERGYLPEALFNFLSLLGWSPIGEEEIFTKEELIKIFDISRLSKAPSKFNLEKLVWTNNYYINKLNKKELYDFLNPFVSHVTLSEEMKNQIFKLYQAQLNEGSEIIELIKIFTEMKTPSEEEIKVMNEGKEVIHLFVSKMKDREFKYDEIKKTLNEVSVELDVKGPKLFKPIRIKLLGTSTSPDISSVVEIFGKKTTLERLEK